MKAERYDVGKIVGTGAFATVHEATDVRLDSVVAIKVLAQNWAADPSVCERFGREATLLRRVRSSHRNAPLAEVFDIDQTDDGRPYFVMSFADRGTLSARWKPGEPWPVDRVVPIINTLADGLHALHSEGVVHRDIKPSNMLYVSQPSSVGGEELLIGDLGLAKDTLTSTSDLTVAGGTPGYMAPEQAFPDAVITPAADIYSATVLVAELLTGVRGVGAIDSLPPSAQSEFRRGIHQQAPARHSNIREWQQRIVAVLHNEATAVSAPLVLPPPPPPPAAAVPTSVDAGGLHLSDHTHVAPSPVRKVAEMGVTDTEPPIPLAPGIQDASPASPSRSSSKSSSKRVVAIGGAALVALLIAVAGANLLLRGASTIDIDGPTEASVGETFFLRPDLPADARSHMWLVGGQTISDSDLSLTPSSAGQIVVELTATLADGSTETATHQINVS